MNLILLRSEKNNEDWMPWSNNIFSNSSIQQCSKYFTFCSFKHWFPNVVQWGSRYRPNNSRHSESSFIISSFVKILVKGGLCEWTPLGTLRMILSFPRRDSYSFWNASFAAKNNSSYGCLEPSASSLQIGSPLLVI